MLGELLFSPEIRLCFLVISCHRDRQVRKNLNWVSLHQHLSHSFNQVTKTHEKIKAALQNDGYSKSRVPKPKGSQVNRDR